MADDQTLIERARTTGLFPIHMAVADYDRTRTIIDGRIRPAGIALDVEARYVGDFCNKPVYEEYDAAEMSFSWYVTARSRGEPVVALPVFPLRMPVFAYVFVREDSHFYEPKDLAGARIGTPAYRFTVNLWLRGIFQENHGLAPQDVTWVTCRNVDDAGYEPPPGIRIVHEEGHTPEQLIECGLADAIFVPGPLRSFVPGKSKLRRLFKDAQAEMHGYVARAGFLPVTHCVVMKQSLAEREPWISESLVRAFMDAQRHADAACQFDPKQYSMADAIFFLEQHRAAYGGDSWPHGVAPNRAVIETFLRYANEQGYTSRRLAVEELFPANTLGL